MNKKNKKKRHYDVYMLRCSDGTLYTGCALDLNQRVKTHNSGVGAKYTRGRLPVKLIWHKRCKDLSQALKEEKRIKKFTKKQKQELITSCIF